MAKETLTLIAANQCTTIIKTSYDNNKIQSNSYSHKEI